MTGSVAIKSTTFIRSWFLPLLPTIPIKVETTSAVNVSFACIGCLHTVLWEIENSISSGFVTIDFGYSFIRSFKPHHIRPCQISSVSSSLWSSHRYPHTVLQKSRLWLNPEFFFAFQYQYLDSSVDTSSSWTTMFFRGKGAHVDTGYGCKVLFLHRWKPTCLCFLFIFLLTLPVYLG